MKLSKFILALFIACSLMWQSCREDSVNVHTESQALSSVEVSSSRSTADVEIPDWALNRTDLPFDVKGYLQSLQTLKQDNAAPGYEVVFDRLTESKFSVESTYRQWQDSPESLTIEDLRIANELMAPYLELVDAAQKHRDCLFIDKIDWGSLLPPMILPREIAQMCCLQVAYAARVGDIEMVLKACGRGHRLADDLSTNTGDYSLILAVSIKSILSQAVLDEVLTSEELSKDDCQLLIDFYQSQREQITQDLVSNLKIQYIAFNNAIYNPNLLVEYGLELDHLARYFDVEAERRFADRKYKVLVDGIENSSGTFRELNQIYCEQSREHDRLHRELNEDLSNPLSNLLHFSGLKPFRHPIVSLKIDCVSSLNLPSVLHRGVARNRAMQCLIACQSWKILHGAFPANDAELTLAIQALGASGIPRDPFLDNSPLQYRLLSDGPLVYSVGSNELDDFPLTTDLNQLRLLDLPYRIRPPFKIEESRSESEEE